MEEILFILHVDNGVHIIIHIVIWYNNTYSNTKNSIIILIFLRISLFFGIIVQTLFCQFVENGNRYKAETFSVNLFFKKLSNDISHFVVG